MKKVISILFLVVAMVTFMAGCNTKPNEPMNSVPKADVVTEPITQSEPVATTESELKTATQPEPLVIKNVDFEFTSDYQGGGMYNKAGFGDEYAVYRFEDTNVVVFELNIHHGGGWYMIGEDIGEATGISRGSDIGMYGRQFLALSNKYMLFLTENGKVAKDLIERREEREDGIFLVHDAIPFEELPVEEQKAFVYPCSYEEFSNITEKGTN